MEELTTEDDKMVFNKNTVEALHTEEENKEKISENVKALPTETTNKSISANVEPLTS